MINSSNLKGKKILFFAPDFFGYELKIRSKMEELGATVSFFDERATKSSYLKALLKVEPRILNPLSNKYYDKVLLGLERDDFDFVIFIKCEMISLSMLRKYREIFKSAQFILYLYDSLSNIKHIREKLIFFDSVFTFDRKDALQNSGFRFRPLFYIENFERSRILNQQHYDYDVCFIGTIHSDRFKIVKEIQQQCIQLGLRFFTYLYLQNRTMYWLYRFTKPEFRGSTPNDFRFEKASFSDVGKWIDSSKVVLDIQHPCQTGLTMRTIELVGMRKKTVTTNEEVSLYDFYDQANISIMDRECVNLDKGFFALDFKAVPEEILNQYSLEQWVSDLVSESNDKSFSRIDRVE